MLLMSIVWLESVLDDSFATFLSVFTLLFKQSNISMQQVTDELFCSRFSLRILTEFLVENWLLSKLAILASMLSSNILYLSFISLSRNTALNAGFVQMGQNH